MCERHDCAGPPAHAGQASEFAEEYLSPGGYLFSGQAESLVGMNVPARPVMASVYQKPLQEE